MRGKYKLPPETKLIPTIKASKDYIAPGTSSVECEVDSGFGIADVVFFNLDKRIANQRKRIGIPIMKSFEILETFSVINKLHSKKINITHLYKQLPYSQQTFEKKILHFLVKNGIAENIDNTYLDFKFQYKISLKETVAVEAKVANWKRGLYQAYRYKQYADYSYLALHLNYISPALNGIHLFRELNVGLISVDEKHNTLSVLYKPKKEPVSITEKIKYYANEDILFKGGFIEVYTNL